MLPIKDSDLFRNFSDGLEKLVQDKVNDYYAEIGTIKEIKQIKNENYELKQTNNSLEKDNKEMKKMLEEVEEFLNSLDFLKNDYIDGYHGPVGMRYEYKNKNLDLIY